jgi:hypothetical protein
VETVAFYSYKGGVGRSLLLANAAWYLAAIGKSVVALDFDFEAPGLHYKLVGRQHLLRPDQLTYGAVMNERDPFTLSFGVVPYLNATVEGTGSPPPIEEHIVTVSQADAKGWIKLMPAGPAPSQIYWAALKELNDNLRLSDPSGRGFMAFLDLQARIADELKPDYLLIDARTGVTELGSLATTVLADTVVCMFVANQESVDGTLAVAEALTAAPRLASQSPLRVVPLLSRDTAQRSEDFEGGIQKLLNLSEGWRLLRLPHDDMLQTSELLAGGAWKPAFSSPLHKAYLDLFRNLFNSDYAARKRPD